MYCSNTDWKSHIHSQQRCKVNAGKGEMEVDGWRTDISECTLPESPTEIKSPYLSLYTVYIHSIMIARRGRSETEKDGGRNGIRGNGEFEEDERSKINGVMMLLSSWW